MLSKITRMAGRWAQQAAAILFWLVALLIDISLPREHFGPLIGMALFLVGWWLSILVHELGHAAGALGCNWRVIVFAVRPFAWQIPNAEVLRLPKTTKKGIPGWVAAVPRSAAVGTRVRFAIFVAAGPAASLAMALLAFAAASGFLEAGQYDAEAAFTAFGIQNLYSTIFTLLPRLRDGAFSDGDRLRGLSRPGWHDVRRIVWTRTLLDCNVRPRDVPAWMLESIGPAGAGADEYAQYLAVMRIGMLLDTLPVAATPRQIETLQAIIAEARRLIDAHRERYGGSEWLDSCDACFTAIWEADGPRAAIALWTGVLSDEMAPMVAAAQAAVAARNGDIALGREQLARMRAALRKESPFHNPTFADIGAPIEALMPQVGAVVAPIA